MISSRYRANWIRRKSKSPIANAIGLHIYCRLIIVSNYSPLFLWVSMRSMFAVNSEAVFVYPVLPCASMLYWLLFDSLDKSNNQTVGYPLTLNACCKFWFCCLNLAGSCFLLGKSNSRSTTFLLAQSLNSLWTNTHLVNFLHHPHQSLPVKLANIGLPVFWDSA